MMHPMLSQFIGALGGRPGSFSAAFMFPDSWEIEDGETGCVWWLSAPPGWFSPPRYINARPGEIGSPVYNRPTIFFNRERPRDRRAVWRAFKKWNHRNKPSAKIVSLAERAT